MSFLQSASGQGWSDDRGGQVLRRVISGGQTGVDKAALHAALDSGFETGGFAPKGYRTLDGYDSSLAAFGRAEHLSGLYAPRTYANVKLADATLRLARVWTSPGELCTLKAIGKYGKPWLDVDSRRPLAAEEVAAWILISGVRT